MKASEFYLCPKEELLIAAKESQKSAQSLFDVAHKAAAAKQFGPANSLLILSVEECIKAAILAAGYFNMKLPFDVEPYFRDHKTKYEQAAEIQPVINLVCKIRDVYIDILRNRKSVYGTVFKLAITNLFAAMGIHLGNEPKDFSEWWGQANKQKNNGFYVGFFNSNWTFPSTTTEATYLQTLSMAKPFVECLQVVHELRHGDNQDFSVDREFTKDEIDGAEIKFIQANSSDHMLPDLSDYRPIENSGEDPSNEKSS